MTGANSVLGVRARAWVVTGAISPSPLLRLSVLVKAGGGGGGGGVSTSCVIVYYNCFCILAYYFSIVLFYVSLYIAQKKNRLIEI